MGPSHSETVHDELYFQKESEIYNEVKELFNPLMNIIIQKPRTRIYKF